VDLGFRAADVVAFGTQSVFDEVDSRDKVPRANTIVSPKRQSESDEARRHQLESEIEAVRQELREAKAKLLDKQKEEHQIRQEAEARLEAEEIKIQKQREAEVAAERLKRQQDSEQRKALIALQRRIGKTAESPNPATLSPTATTIATRESQVGGKPNSTEKSVPVLSPTTYDLYFAVAKREKTANDLENMSGEMVEESSDQELCARLATAVMIEEKLFQEMSSSIESIVETERQELEKAVQRQKLRVQKMEQQLSKNVLNEVSRQKKLDEDTRRVKENSSHSDQNSDASSSDSEILSNTSKTVELTKTADGSIRISIGLQINTISATAMVPEDFHRMAHEVVKKDRAIEQAAATLVTMIDNLERCSEVLEREILCPSCERPNQELFIIWPCGHHFCLDCIYEQERLEGGYSCMECHNVTSDMPVSNLVMNSIAARVNFRRSGFLFLREALALFHQEALETTKKMYEKITLFHFWPWGQSNSNL
jgi:hypothetical protein